MSGRLALSTGLWIARAWIAAAPTLAALLAFSSLRGAQAAQPQGATSEATSSSLARKEAIESIPYGKLDAEGRKKVDSVLSDIAVFRRLPTRSVNCDPEIYLFLVRHPDALVNIWEVLGVAQLQVRQTDVDHYQIVESEGTTANFQYLYHAYNVHVVYGEWTYTGPLLSRKINGRCLGVMKSTYARDKEGRYFITSRMDGFLSVDSAGAELLTKTLHPLVDKNVDNNFIQTVSFIGSLSRTAEVNTHGMQRLASRLTHVQDDTRQQLDQVITGAAQRCAMGAHKEAAPNAVPPAVASQQPPK
jgi:hypothetical protein